MEEIVTRSVMGNNIDGVVAQPDNLVLHSHALIFGNFYFLIATGTFLKSYSLTLVVTYCSTSEAWQEVESVIQQFVSMVTENFLSQSPAYEPGNQPIDLARGRATTSDILGRTESVYLECRPFRFT
ncbi:hypothetical protein TNCV_3589271 [Trichonephila clavipes]|nr:hypothetical protein TNCV_3589271 [Trichonephila clavipes]